MTESLKFLQNMQEITQLEINQLDAAGQLTDVWNRPAIVKLPNSYLKKLAAAAFAPGIFLLAPSSVIRGALLVDSKHRLLICHITLLTRQAIEGGLAPNEAFALSDQLCQQVESLQTIEQLNARLQATGQIFIQRIQKTQQTQNSQKGLLTQKIETALRDHCGQNYSLDDLAHDLQRDKYYLAHLYKQETGQTINQYENSYRISRFKSMLLWTDQPITEIAAVLGFATPNYASRCFKKIVGIAPQQYRQRHQLNLLHQ